MPSGMFRPYAGVSTAVLLFTKGAATERILFYGRDNVVNNRFEWAERRFSSCTLSSAGAIRFAGDAARAHSRGAARVDAPGRAPLPVPPPPRLCRRLMNRELLIYSW